MDLTLLARDLTGFLAPFLPFLLQAGQQAGQQAGKALGEAAWGRAEALWDVLRAKIEEIPSAEEAVRDVANTPADDDMQAALRVQLRKLLSQDQGLLTEVERLWREAQRSGVVVAAGGERSIAIGGDASNSTIISGDRNRVR